MAISKNDVATAIDTLKSEGKSVTIDGIREVLGTGSKTTIQRFRKELEFENTEARHATATISEQLGSLVDRLAARLREEAEQQVNNCVVIYEEKEDEWLAQLEALQLTLTEKEATIDQLTGQRSELLGTTEKLRSDLQIMSSDCNALHVEVRSRDDAINDKNVMIKSLEDKHQQARDALNHYRESVKEQRDQDLRRHDLQVQQLQLEIRENRTVIQAERKNAEQAKDEMRRQSEVIASQKAQLEGLEDQQSKLLIKQADLLTQVENSKASLQQSLYENSKLLADRQQTNRQYDSLLATNKHLNEKLRDMEQKLTASESRFEAQAAMINQINQQFDKFQASLIEKTK